ncbi:MAG: RloB family protein [Thiotrichaceae bacterium]
MPPKRKNEQKPTSRKQGRILIVCEGSKTEYNYFSSFKQMLAGFRNKSKANDVIVLDVQHADGKTTANQIVKKAKIAKENATLDYLEIWCVFDKDNDEQNLPKDYNDIIATRVKSEGLKVAYSNPSFELWYLLHFCSYNVQLPYKNCCIAELTKYLGRAYSKTDPMLFNELKQKQPKAIDRAKDLMEMWQTRTDFANHNPSTTVHELVEMLNNYLEKVQNAAK